MRKTTGRVVRKTNRPNRHPKVLRDQLCPICQKKTLVVRYETRRNYTHGKLSKPVYSTKSKIEICSNKKCNHRAKYTNPPLRNVDYPES